MSTIFSALAGAERVFAILAQRKPETADVNDVIDMNEKDIQGAVVFDNVTFGYKPRQDCS